MALANPRRRRRGLRIARRVVHAYRNPGGTMRGRIGAGIKTAAIGMVGMAALDILTPLVTKLVSGVTGGITGQNVPAGAGGGAQVAGIVDPKTGAAILSLIVLARSRPGGVIHTASSFAFAKALYDMFGGQIKQLAAGIQIPGLSGLGWFPQTAIPAYRSDTVTGRTYSQFASAY